jgi:hypothetical protein
LQLAFADAANMTEFVNDGTLLCTDEQQQKAQRLVDVSHEIQMPLHNRPIRKR